MSTGPWTADNLEQFAKRIETRLRRSANSDSIERLICRLLTSAPPAVRSALLVKWVEWRYGKSAGDNQTVSIVFDGPRAKHEEPKPKVVIQ